MTYIPYFLFQKKNNLKSRYGSKGIRASKLSLNKSQAFDMQSMFLGVSNAPVGKLSKNQVAPMPQHTLEVGGICFIYVSNILEFQVGPFDP